MNFKQKLFLTLFSSVLLVGCNDDNDPIDPPPEPEPATTSFAVSVLLPAGVTVVQNNTFDPVDLFFNKAVAVDEEVTGLDLTNFEVRLYDADGVDYTLVEIDEFIDNGDGTYFILVVGEPRIDCILVSVLQVNGEAVELQIPATDEGSQADPLVINYASTAATTQYIESIVEAGGFSEELTVDEVGALIEEVAAQIASVVLPDDVDPNDPSAVLDALNDVAGDLVDAQIKIATAPEPVAGSLAAFAGNYNAAVFGRSVVGDVQGFFVESEIFFEDFTFAPNEQSGALEAVLAGIPIAVDEAEKTTTLVFGSAVETSFGRVFAGPNLTSSGFFRQEASTDDEELTADILPDGELIVNTGGQIGGGSIFEDGADSRD